VKSLVILFTLRKIFLWDHVHKFISADQIQQLTCGQKRENLFSLLLIKMVMFSVDQKCGMLIKRWTTATN
jgi:hypothetical protein